VVCLQGKPGDGSPFKKGGGRGGKGWWIGRVLAVKSRRIAGGLYDEGAGNEFLFVERRKVGEVSGRRYLKTEKGEKRFSSVQDEEWGTTKRKQQP